LLLFIFDLEFGVIILLKYWGKISKNKDSDLLLFHPLIAHSIDVLQTAMRIAFLNDIKLSSHDLFLIAIHDLGKSTCGFQVGMKNFKDNSQIKDRYFDTHNRRITVGYNEHHSTSGINVFDIIRKVGIKDNNFLNSIKSEGHLSASFGHHGYPVKRTISLSKKVCKNISDDKKFGNFLPVYDLIPSIDFVNFFLEKLNISKDESFKSYLTSWELAGLTCLSDWIASSEDNFPYVGFDNFNTDDYFIKSEERVNLINDKMLKFGSNILDNNFETVFGFNSPTNLQDYCNKEKSSNMNAGIYFIEDSAGSGKTEASLCLAQKILLSSKNIMNGGIFFALPTMATSNAIYKRIIPISKKLFSNPDVILSHSEAKNANLSFLKNKKYSNDDKMNTAEYDAFEWFNDNKKKALLSHFGVGTVDTLLSAMLPLKHQALKMFGIRNKVLILDEVHSYDVYMGKEIESLISFHSSHGGSVIISSATLTADIKNRLSKAFYKGIEVGNNKVNIKGIKEDYFKINDPFPMFATLENIDDIVEFKSNSISTPDHLKKKISWERMSKIEDVTLKIKDCVDKGGNVCIIRNTVNSAIDTYEALNEEGLTSILFHSRFVKYDKNNIENDVIEKFGKNGSAKGQVLVATQVAEQSLDVDFDLMITDIAPAEYLVQRAGRCHRHIKRRPHGYENPKVIVLAGELTVEWLSPNKGTAFVYNHVKTSWLTLEYIIENPVINLPEMSREFIEYSYSNRLVPDFIQEQEDNASYNHDLVAKSAASLSILKTVDGYTLNSDKQNGCLWNCETKESELSTRLIKDSVQVKVILDEKDYGFISIKSSILRKMDIKLEDNNYVAKFISDEDVYSNGEIKYNHKKGLIV